MIIETLRLFFLLLKESAIHSQLDCTTNLGLHGHYARVSVNLDVASPLSASITLECENFGFSIEIVYGVLPKYCTKCGFLRHEFVNCRKRAEESISTKVYHRPTNMVFF